VAVMAGVSQLLRIGAAADGRAKLFRVLAGVLYLVGGGFVLIFPLGSTFSLTLSIGALLLMEGVTELAGAASAADSARNVLLVDGLITCLLGGMVLLEWPSDSLWVIGTLFGVGLLISAFRLLFSSEAQSPQTSS
jgi:uncharacterized membrane protein HdeD (DUF308 family)